MHIPTLPYTIHNIKEKKIKQNAIKFLSKLDNIKTDYKMPHKAIDSQRTKPYRKNLACINFTLVNIMNF